MKKRINNLALIMVSFISYAGYSKSIEEPEALVVTGPGYRSQTKILDIRVIGFAIRAHSSYQS